MYLETELKSNRNKRKLVFGCGVNDWKYRSYFNGKPVWQYRLWSGMLERSCCNKFKLREPSYSDVSCDERWLSLSNFIEDVICIENYSKFYTDGWHFDKDLLVKGNKKYSISNVCFVPNEINTLLTKSNASRGDAYIGVHFNKRQGKYTASVANGVGKKIYLGVFDNPKSAFYAYKIEKERVIKMVASEWRGIISENVYTALMNYEVEIHD